MTLWTGCSDNAPEVAGVESYSIIEYAKTGDVLRCAICVFADVSSDAHRAQSVRLICKSNHYEWTVLEPLIFTSDGISYSGYTNFAYPNGSKITQGVYTFEYTDAQQKVTAQDFTVNIPSGINFTAKASDTISIIKKDFAGKYVKKHALFDEAGKLLYYGNIAKTFPGSDIENVMGRYPDAKFYKECYVFADNRFIVVMQGTNKDDDASATKKTLPESATSQENAARPHTQENATDGDSLQDKSLPQQDDDSKETFGDKDAE